MRERKNKHLEDLQQRILELEKENEDLKSIANTMAGSLISLDNVEVLTSFSFPSFEMNPPQQWPGHYSPDSLASQDSNFAQISLTYDYDKFVTERIPQSEGSNT